MKLIDLDASMSYRSGTEMSATKYSSGYVPPELVHISGQVAFIKSKSNRGMISGTNGDFQMVPVAPSQDLWALGVVLYNLATNGTLFLCDGDGNIQSQSDLSLLQEWSVTLKLEKLSRVVNPEARNLISLLLNKDPSKRGKIASILRHSFFTGKHMSLDLSVDRFDMFLSYRYDSDFTHAEILYSLLVNEGIKVWWDKRSLKPGEPWEVGFCKGLLKSNVFCLLVSKGAVSNFSDLCADSPVDNVLLEIMLALELYERGVVEKIFPLFIGEKDPGTGLYLKYTFHGEDACHPPSFPNCIVNSIDERLKIRLDDLGLGLPYFKAMSVAEVMTNLMR
jgi:serine/threonine protein kinase